MGMERIKTQVSSLEKGMYVSDLDRPWNETPFPLQGFYVKSDQDIRVVKKFCHYVYIDSIKSREGGDYDEHQAAGKGKGSVIGGNSRTAGAKAEPLATLELPPLSIKDPQHYEVSAPLHKEASRVKRIHTRLRQSVRSICESAAQGESVNVEEVQSLAVSMVVSVVRNPDALVWLTKMEDEDQHGYQHVIRASVWALVFARHIGLNKSLMKTLATGILLSHIGKVRLPEHVREAEGQLDDKDLATYQTYVDLGLETLKDVPGLGDGVLNVVEFHAERHNGAGFPKGVTGDSIPLLAKIAGLVDAYQTLITPRVDRAGLSPKDAVSVLYEQRNVLFQKDLVERFIEAIGIFPTGTLVELSNNQVGIVCGHNPERRLLPKVILVTDNEKTPLKNGRRVDLIEWNSTQGRDKALHIRDSLPKGAFGIDENSYLLSGATSKWSVKHLVSNFA